MKKVKRTKLIQVGRYIAEVDIELIDDPNGWSPYLSLEDAYRLDEVRETLLRGDLKAASKISRVYSLTPIAV